MKDKPPYRAKVWSILSAVLLGFGLICAIWFLYYSHLEKQSREICSQLPQSFSQTDLVGTWIAGLPHRSDTLIIKADGTYKQIVHVETDDRPLINFESGWQYWHLNKSEDNITYIYLVGLRLCGMNPDISCEEHLDGNFDFCHNRFIDLINEGALIVAPVYNNDLFGNHIALDHIYLAYRSLDTGWSYFLQEP